jgi:hypothetical protein
MASDNPRYQAELLEDEGVNPEASGDEPKPIAPPKDPFALIVETMAIIKGAIEAGDMKTAKERISFVDSMIRMGLTLAEGNNLKALKSSLEAQRKILDGFEAQIKG